MTEKSKTIHQVEAISTEDCNALYKSEQSYGDSWKKRGGVGAFMMLARKWDRIEKQVSDSHLYDIFSAYTYDAREEGIIDDIKDLRRYLLLVEAEMIIRKEQKENQGELFHARKMDNEEYDARN